MAWMSKRPFLLRVACGFVAGVSAATGTVYFYNNGNPLKRIVLATESNSSEDVSDTTLLGKVLASWTTNFKPSKEWDNNWDRREPSVLIKPDKGDATENDKENNLKKVTPTATRHLFFIRHGQYNMDGEGDIDRYLSPLGREQAGYTGARLKELDYPYVKMVNSTMTRAKETADIVAEYLPNDLPRDSCDMLREGAPYPPEPPIGHWRPERYQFFEDGARIEAAFRKYFHRASSRQEKDTYEIYVCHANVIRYFVCRALQLPPEAWLRMSLHNGSMTWFAIRPSGRVSIRTVGDCGHIPKDKLTTT